MKTKNAFNKWLSDNGLTHSVFAEQVGCSVSAVDKLATMKRKPSWLMFRAIQARYPDCPAVR